MGTTGDTPSDSGFVGSYEPVPVVPGPARPRGWSDPERTVKRPGKRGLPNTGGTRLEFRSKSPGPRVTGRRHGWGDSTPRKTPNLSVPGVSSSPRLGFFGLEKLSVTVKNVPGTPRGPSSSGFLFPLPRRFIGPGPRQGPPQQVTCLPSEGKGVSGPG